MDLSDVAQETQTGQHLSDRAGSIDLLAEADCFVVVTSRSARAWTEALAIYSGLGPAEPEAVRAKLGPGTTPGA